LVTFTNTSTGYRNQYRWDFGDGGTSTLRNPFHVYQTPGVYDVRLIITSRFGCVDTITKQNLIRIDGPIGSFEFDTNFGCEGAQINFQANISNTKVIIWDFDDGFTLVGQSNRTHTYNTAGTYFPRITIQDSVGCTRAIIAEDSILIDIVPDIQLPNDTVVCQGNNVYLDSKVQQAFSFQWIPTNDLTCPTCPATLSTTRQDRTYVFTAVSQYGCSNTDSTTILIDTIILPNVLGEINLCPGEQVTLNQNGDVLPLSQWNPKNYWEPALYMDDSTIATPTIAPLDTITYRLTAFPKNNCRTGSGNFASVSRLIATFLPIDKVEVATINDTFVCPGDSVLLESSVIAASEYGYDVLWQPAFAVDRPQVLSPFAIPPATTNYRLILSSTTCEPDTARVRVELKSRPFVDAGPDQTVIAGSSIPMYADAGNDVQFQWKPFGEFECDTCYSTQLTPASSGMYYVQVTDEFGCRNIDSVFVFVKSECGQEGLFLPTAFSPNGDGNNDVYRIRSLGIREIEFFRIFNRWGELVFETNDINQGWDGRNGNGYYSSGVYTFFVRAVCPDGTLSEFNGNLTIIR
jgi:gliding motility-associated-like protein